MRKAVRRSIEHMNNVFLRVRRKTPTTSRREAHISNTGLRLNTGGDLLVARIDYSDNSLNTVHHIDRVAEL
jgi:hypothetical protein